MPIKFYIVTGLSGAGKSQALKILEDLGYSCVDNLPLILVPKFAELCAQLKGKWGRVAIGIDARAGDLSLPSLNEVLFQIKKKGIEYKIIYFTANDSTLLHRYSETRRKHPLGKRVIDGITRERRIMEKILPLADKEIDTSYLTLGELKEILAREMEIASKNNITISLLSFGYKYGMPLSADLVIDVRFLPNPNYIPGLRSKTGRDSEVKRYVKRQKSSKEFFKRFFGLLNFLLPFYIKEGKSYLTLAIGCTGGRHRSVVVTEESAQFLRSKKYHVHVYHRDSDRIGNTKYS